MTTLHNFGTEDADLRSPDASLVQGNSGNLFGTTSEAGTNGTGTVFRMNRAGT